MAIIVRRAEIAPGKVEVYFSDGTETEIEDGVLTRYNAARVQIEQRDATAADIEAILEQVDEARSLKRTLEDGTEIRSDPDGIDVRYPDGSRESIEDGRYEFRDEDGDRIRRPATADDIARLEALRDQPIDIEPGDDLNEIPGTPGDDDLRGTDGADRMTGGAGDDELRGRGGDDDISGGADDDELRGESGNDSVAGGDGNDLVRGDAGNDLLFGDAGNDRVIGGGGNDTLDGGTGNDRFAGGLGADTFVLAPGDGFDRIQDFVSGVDVIDLTAYGFADIDAVLALVREAGGDSVLILDDDARVRVDNAVGLSEGDFLI